MSDTEAEQVERLFGVWSVTGVHIGVWNDGLIAAMVHADEHPHGRLLEMVPAKDYDALSTQLAEATEKGRQGLRVKPLDWSDTGTWENQPAYYADSSMGWVQVVDHRQHGNGFRVYPPWEEGDPVRHPTLEAAKAAAQADYERRILSALTEAPARDPVGEAFHDEQVRIWAGEIMEALALSDILKIDTYDDKVSAYCAVERELKAIGRALSGDDVG